MRRSMKDWEEIVNAQEASNQSARKFCDDNSIGLASFYKWRGRFKKKSQPDNDRALANGFVDVGAINSDQLRSSGNGWKVSLDLGELRLTLERG